MPGQLHDLNLSEVCFSDDGVSVSFALGDTFDPNKITRVVCDQIYSFNYRGTFDDGLPVYVGEVTWQELSGAAREELLDEIGFPFYGESGRVYCPPNETLCVLHMEGGEVYLDVICGQLRLLTSPENPV